MNSTRPICFGSVLIAVALAGSRAYGGGYSNNSLTPLTNLVVCAGDNATFSTTASGPTPYKFQWYKGASALSGKTNSSLTLTSVSAADVATYSVQLTGGHNSVTNSATLALKTPVSLTPLTDLVRSIGANAVFSTVASGTPPFTYVWKKNGTNISNQTGSSLTLSNLKTNDSGTYTVVVTGSCGSTATCSAILLVDTCFPAVDVALVIDRSGSMTGKPYDDARLACSNFVHNLNYAANADQAALASYNSAATLDQKLTNNMQVLEQAIGAIPAANGNTSISLGLQTGQAELVSSRHRSQSLPVLVLLSDGLPTGGDTASNALYNATQAKNAGTRIFTVGLGAVDHTLMSGIASSTNDYFYTTNSAQLGALFNAISTIICRPPTNIFLSGLSNLTLCPGLTANFNVTASGCAPFSYQWKKDGFTLAGQTNSSLVIPNVSATNAGTYSVEVTGECKTVTNSATLFVNAPVIVSTPLTSQTNCPGTTAMFNVGATGTGLSYQWYKGTAALNGQTGNSLTLTNVNTGSTGTYSVVIMGACGLPVTNSANLALNSPVTIVTPPSNQIACPSGMTTFSVSATGTGLSYQWLKSGTVLTGRTNSSLGLTGIIPADQGIYSVIVSGTCSRVTNSATLTVNSPVSATPLTSQTNCAGSTVIFSTIASGTGPFGYAWFKNGNLIGGESGGSLVLSNITSGSVGIYSIVVSGACGSVTNAATLAVNLPVSAAGPVNQTNCAGTTAIFSTVASGTGPFSYQWYRGANALTGETNSSLTLNAVTLSNAATYQVVVSGVCNSVTNSATLTVNTPVSSAFLFSETNCPGGTEVFDAIASGTGPFSYVWSKNGNLLAETGSLLMVTNLSPNDAGTYSVVITGACGSVTNSGHLTISTPVSATPLASQTNCPGSTVIFSTTASGTAPFTFAWFKNGNLIGNEFGSSLVLSNVSAESIGTYSVIVNGSCGSATNFATLALNTPVSAVGPVDQTNCPGTTAIFNTVAGGTGPFSYQWYRGALALNGETNSSLTLNGVTQFDVAAYQVVVSGACGSVTNSAQLDVRTAITATPLVSRTNCPGTMVVFSTEVSGTGPYASQWFKDGLALDGETGLSLALTNVSTGSPGVYSIVVNGPCNSVTNNASLIINSVVSAVGPMDQTNCPGTMAVLSTVASGTGPYSYQWFKNSDLLMGETKANLVLTNVSALDAAVYQVIVSGACQSVTNSASLSVYESTAVPAMAILVRNVGESATFSVSASGTGPFTYVWKKENVVIAGQTGSSLTLTNISFADEGTYAVEVTGRCNTAVQSASLHVNIPPTISIFSPTNGTSFVVPANFTLAANAFDIDGSVTNVEFFEGTNKLGETAVGNPFVTVLTNVDIGSHTYTAKATDNNGASGVASPVSILVLNSLPLTVITATHFNPQTGLYEQKVRVTNPTYSPFEAVRVYVSGLQAGVNVYNASGTTNGLPYVQSSGGVQPGSYVDLVIEYHVTVGGLVPNPILFAERVPIPSGGSSTVIGTGLHINRAFVTPDLGFLVEFMSVSNRVYRIQYTRDLKTWSTVPTAITGTGTWIQWVDNGEPKTESAPSTTGVRFYRVIVLP